MAPAFPQVLLRGALVEARIIPGGPVPAGEIPFDDEA
jgi:hypothetical protein